MFSSATLRSASVRAAFSRSKGTSAAALFFSAAADAAVACGADVVVVMGASGVSRLM